MNDIFGQFDLPDVAREQLRAQGYKPFDLGDGVTKFAGHDNGVAFRFFTIQEFNKKKSLASKYERFDTITMIEWLVDRRHKPVERVTMIGDELLQFDPETGECLGGKFAEAYKRFITGQTAPGLPLSKWGVLSDSDVATLAANGIFSVEQFAAQPRSKIAGKFPEEFVEAFERAILHVNSKEHTQKMDQIADELAAQKAENQRLAAIVAKLEAQAGEAPKKRGRKAKQEVEHETVS